MPQSDMQVEYLLSPVFEELEARYQAVIAEIYAEARAQMAGASLRSQEHIHRSAVEQAWPFVEEIGRIRAHATMRVTVPAEWPINSNPDMEYSKDGFRE